MGQTAETEHVWRPAVEMAKATRARNNALRGSKLGRLLLTLERCSRFCGSHVEPISRRFSPFLNELRHACKLADEAGIAYGSFRDSFGALLLAFDLGCGDIVFCTFYTSLATKVFPRRPDPLNNNAVLAQAIEDRLTRVRPQQLAASQKA
jgi:hypothetical protein